MVRSVDKKYQIWLAGYYDDFNGARAIPDDRNQPTDSSYSALKSHFGNPMNGEAFINPRFRFSIEERLQDSAKQVASSSNQYLQNDGIFEWLSLDDTRLNFSHWEGRAQLQYPDGHIAANNTQNVDIGVTTTALLACQQHDADSSSDINSYGFTLVFGDLA